MRRTCLLLILSLPLDLLFVSSEGSSTELWFSWLSFLLLVAGVATSFQVFQNHLLKLLVTIQKETLLTRNWRVPLIAGGILLLSGLLEAATFVAKLNPIAILVGIWILGVTATSTIKDLQIRNKALSTPRDREILLSQRIISQSFLLHCVPLVLLRLTSMSMLFDVSTIHAHALHSWIIVLGCLALMLICFPNEIATTTQCPRCHARLPRALRVLAACHFCSAEAKHRGPAKLAPQEKTTLALRQNTGVLEKLWGGESDVASASLRLRTEAQLAK